MRMPDAGCTDRPLPASAKPGRNGTQLLTCDVGTDDEDITSVIFVDLRLTRYINYSMPPKRKNKSGVKSGSEAGPQIADAAPPDAAPVPIQTERHVDDGPQASTPVPETPADCSVTAPCAACAALLQEGELKASPPLFRPSRRPVCAATPPASCSPGITACSSAPCVVP